MPLGVGFFLHFCILDVDLEPPAYVCAFGGGCSMQLVPKVCGAVLKKLIIFSRITRCSTLPELLIKEKKKKLFYFGMNSSVGSMLFSFFFFFGLSCK